MFVLPSAVVMRSEVALRIFPFTLSQSLNVLMKYNRVFLNFYAVPDRSCLLTARINLSFGVLLKVL